MISFMGPVFPAREKSQISFGRSSAISAGTQRALHQLRLAPAEGDLQRLGMGGRGHLLPGFLQGVDNFVVIGFVETLRHQFF